jgi:hypothetical protein
MHVEAEKLSLGTSRGSNPAIIPGSRLVYYIGKFWSGEDFYHEGYEWTECAPMRIIKAAIEEAHSLIEGKVQRMTIYFGW